jgi:phage terminase small subunit
VRVLTPKQQRFVAEYLVDLNGKQAAIRAGYSPKTAEVQASRLLRNAQVAEAVSTGAEKRLKKLDISADRVLQEIARLAFSDVRAWFDEHGRLLPIHELSADVAAALGSIEVQREKTRVKSTDTEEITVEESVIKIKAWDKPRSLDMLAKHFGLLKDRIELTGKDGGPVAVRFIEIAAQNADRSSPGA